MIDKLKDIWNLPLVKNTMTLSFSSAFMIFLPLVATPILSRIYTPEDYGEWGVFSSVLYIVCSFYFLSYENTIVKTNDSEEVPHLLSLCTLIALGIIALIILIFVGGRITGNSFFCDFPSIFLLAISLITSAIYALYNCVANREKQYGILSIASIICGISQVSIRILLGIIPVVAYGLIVGNILAQCIAVIFLTYHLSYIFHQSFLHDVSWTKIKAVAMKNKKFPLYDAPARFIEFAIGNLAVILLSFFWSRDEIGCYSMIVQFILIPIALIGSAMANVFYKELSESITDKTKIALTTTRAAKISFVISLFPILFLTFGGDHLLVIVLGDQWISAGKMALCMVIYSVPLILSEPLLPVFRSLDKQETRFKLNILCFCLSIGSLLISSLLTKDIYVVLIIYSTFYAFVRFLMYHAILKLAQIQISNISSYFIYAITFCYTALAVRIYWDFF